MEKTIGFIITRHVNSEKTNEYWIECIKNIRNLYENNLIVVIDDNSNYDYIDNKDVDLTNCIIIQSEYPGKGEILAYYYFHKNKFFDIAIIIHDSVFLREKIDLDDFSEVKYFWSFRHIWNNEIEEKRLISFLNKSNDLTYFYGILNLWKGCFGLMSIINYEFLNKIQEIYNFFILLNHIETRNERMCLERIFGVLCHIEKKEINTIYMEIHDYIKWGYSYDEYIDDKINNRIIRPTIKIWSGR